MFDFDEIETDVQKKGADAWKEGAGQKDEAKPSASSAAEAPTPVAAEKPKKADITVRIGFAQQGRRWNQEFKVQQGSSILELKRLIAKGNPEESSWFQLMKGGLPALDNELLEKDQRLEFAYLPPRGKEEIQELDVGAAPAGGWQGELDVTVCFDAISLASEVFRVKRGSTVLDLKQQMAKQDPTGQTQTDSFDLAVNGPGGRCPVASSTVIADGRLSQLSLVAAVA